MTGVPGLGHVASTMARSEIRGMMEHAWRLPAAIRLEVGQPDFSTPAHIVQAASEAALRGETGYAPNAGIPQLREALATKVTERNGYAATADQVVVTNGATEGLYTTLRVLTDPGDEVLLPDPAWPNYRMIAHLLGLVVRPYGLRADTGFRPDLDEIDGLIGPRTKALLVVSPSNPLGVVLPPEDAVAISELAQRRNVWLMSDEVYDELVFDGTHTSIAAVAPSESLISLYSFSKVYAMCGWRVGYVVAPRRVTGVLTDIQEPITSCINTPAQHGAVAAVDGPQEAVAVMRDAYRRRRDIALAEVRRAGLTAFAPAGAFYVWVDVSPAGLRSDILARRLLDERAVCVAPGTAFGDGGDSAVRLCLAAAEEDIVEGIRRLGAFCSEHAVEHVAASTRPAP